MKDNGRLLVPGCVLMSLLSKLAFEQPRKWDVPINVAPCPVRYFLVRALFLHFTCSQISCSHHKGHFPSVNHSVLERVKVNVNILLLSIIKRRTRKNWHIIAVYMLVGTISFIACTGFILNILSWPLSAFSWHLKIFCFLVSKF